MSILSLLTFVDRKHENGDIYTFSFTTRKKLDHKAGQHGVFLLPGLFRPHPFTLSSAPEEKYISISTHTATGSRYKNRLLKMVGGEKIILVGPMLNFTFTEGQTKYAFLAQGIGITPFRSMLVHAHEANLPITTTLIHVDSNEQTFMSLTKEYATEAYYPKSSDEFQTLVRTLSTDQIFYLSGNPRFVSATKKLLIGNAVKPKNIRTDSFLGY